MKKVCNELAIDIDYHLKAVKTHKGLWKVFTVKWHNSKEQNLCFPGREVWISDTTLPITFCPEAVALHEHLGKEKLFLPSRFSSMVKSLPCIQWLRRQLTNSMVDSSVPVLRVGRMLTGDCIPHSLPFSRVSVRVAHTSLSHLSLTLEIAAILHTDWHLLFSGHLVVKNDEK